jgi:phospholipid/cholesterol/gamma-HCH transport system substrate-binding protein
MSPYRRNLLVGVTVLAALGILGWMMIQFGSAIATPFAPETIRITLRSPRADGLAEGSGVLFRGVSVGQVKRVYRVPDDENVVIEADVEKSPPLPANLRGVIRFQGVLGGGSSMYLELTDPQPQGQLERGATLEATFAGLDFLPPEFAALATELRETARQFRESNVINHLDEQVRRVGQVVDDIRSVTGDEKVREDLKASIANIRATTEKADKLAGRLEQLSVEASDTLATAKGAIGRTETEIVSISKQIGERLAQAGKLVEQFQSISAKIDAGQGTGGKLVNDPRLYESLVMTVEQLQATVVDLQRLIRQWEQEGVYLRMR